MYKNNKKCLSNQTVTKQDLPKYHAEQNPNYQTDALRKEQNKGLFAKTDSLVDKVLACPHINLSNWQILQPDGIETSVLLSEIAQQLRCINADVPDVCFNLLDAAGISPTLVLNHNAEAKWIGSWVPFNL